jgi:hypothetical protein
MIEQRIKDQFPAVFITLVSVLVGLALSDLVAEARAHMTLWPLNLATLRTWAQIFANGTSAIAVWIVFAHVGIARRRVPDIFDSLIAFGPPLLLLMANSFVGQKEIWRGSITRPFISLSALSRATCTRAWPCANRNWHRSAHCSA